MANTNPDDVQGGQATAVMVVSYLFIAITILFTAGRIAIVSLRNRKLGWDDGLLIVAVLFGFLSALCIGNAVINGLGSSISAVHSGQLARYFKLSYASNIFVILAMAASKHSVVALGQRLAASTAPLARYLRLMHAVILSWTLFSVFGIAFQCEVPDPWLYSPTRCAGHGAIWYPILAISMVIDVILAFIYIPAVQDYRTESKRKRSIMGLFLLRLIVPIFTIAQIAVLASALNKLDQTLVMPVPVMITQVTMNLAIISAAIPALSRAVTSLEPITPDNVASEITTVSLDASHNRAASDEDKKLRDWAFAQLRNTPTPNSLIKDMSVSGSPKKPAELHLKLERTESAPPIPPRSFRRSRSPQLMLDADSTSPRLDMSKEAWFVNSNRTSSMTDDTIDEIKRKF